MLISMKTKECDDGCHFGVTTSRVMKPHGLLKLLHQRVDILALGSYVVTVLTIK